MVLFDVDDGDYDSDGDSGDEWWWFIVRFREELKRIGEAIVQRNKERESDVKYPYLLPTNIANNINI